MLPPCDLHIMLVFGVRMPAHEPQPLFWVGVDDIIPTTRLSGSSLIDCDLDAERAGAE